MSLQDTDIRVDKGNQLMPAKTMSIVEIIESIYGKDAFRSSITQAESKNNMRD